ncbi:MAG: RNA polymerase sigma-70 factor [Actinomycetota bacterium]
MTASIEHTAVFEAERQRLHALAYRMLGSTVDAQDVVQETWLRWERLGQVGRAAIESPAAWLTTAAARLALDTLKSAQRQRERYVGPWLPEPVLTDDDGPLASVELAESLTIGFLVVLERLGPVERAVFLLADVFGESYAEIAPIVERSEGACRQIASRARKRVRDERRRFEPAPSRRADLLHAFMAACAFGQIDDLRRILSDDVVLVSDGGQEVHAARRPVIGFHRVSRLLASLTRRMPQDAQVELHEVNGEPGLLFARRGRPWLVMAFEMHGDQIAAIRIVINPAKLSNLRPPAAS